MTTTAGSLAHANRGLVIAAIGGSNMLGTGTGACPWTKAAGHTYWSTKTGSLVETEAFPSNFGVAVSTMEALRVLGVDTLTVVEHGVAGAGLSTINSTYAAELITHCGTASVRPNLVLVYAGSVDAGNGALRDAAYTNAKALAEDFRTAFGGGCGVIFGGLHTPEAGWSAEDEGVVDDFLAELARDHVLAKTCAWFSNQDAAIAGGGSDHLSGGANGGSATTGQRYAQILWGSGVLT